MNPRKKERFIARNAVDFFSGILGALDNIEQGQPLVEAIGDAFKDVNKKRASENRPPMGFRPELDEEPKPEPEPIEIQVTHMKDGVPYCTEHDRPVIMCYICRDKGKKP